MIINNNTISPLVYAILQIIDFSILLMVYTGIYSEMGFIFVKLDFVDLLIGSINSTTTALYQ